MSSLVLCVFVNRAASDTPLKEWLVQVEINKELQPDTVLILQQPEGGLLLEKENWPRFRLKIPDVLPVRYLDTDYFPLSSIKDVLSHLDESRLLLILDIPAQALLPSVITQPELVSAQPTADPGFVLNYDSFAQYDAGHFELSTLFESSVFSEWGSVTSDFAWRDATNDSTWVRLNSTYSIDFPEHITGLRIGDAVSRSGSWGSAARFLGLQYGTRFSVQPDLITQPFGTFSSEAALPSTVDVYLNSVRVGSHSVAPGPFSITQLPLTSGPGEVNLVVRDMLGREQVITETFYRTPQLLREGLSDYSFESGVLRRHFGMASADYGQGLVTGTFRHGITDALTGEAHLEWVMQHVVNAGLSSDFLLGKYGATYVGAALGKSDVGEGQLLQFGLQLQPFLALALGCRWEWSNGHFFRAGSDQPAPLEQWTGYVNYTVTPGASIGVSYIQQRSSGIDRLYTRNVIGNLNVNIGEWAYLTVTGQMLIDEQTDYTLGLGLMVPLGERTLGSVHSNLRWGTSKTQDVTASYVLNAPYGEGYGYRLESSSTNRHLVSGAIHTRYGSHQIQGVSANGELSTRLTTSGGMGLLGSTFFASRRIDQSFAMVRLPELPHVRVYADNQMIGYTDGNGTLFIPRLRPYQRNPISIAQEDLPLDTQIDALKVEVTPYFRSGVIVDFPVRRIRSGLLRIRLEEGSPLPPGATVHMLGRTFPVAQKGEVYLTGLQSENTLYAEWKSKRCDFSITYPDTDDPLPDLGEIVCTGIEP